MQNERGKESKVDPISVELDTDKPSENGSAPVESPPSDDTDTLTVLEDTLPGKPAALPPAKQAQPVPASPHISSGPIPNDVTGFQSIASPVLPPYQAVAETPFPPHLPASPQLGALPANAALPHVPWQVSDSWGATTLNISANTAAGVSYLFWWISGFLVYFSERNNRFVRFHALQSIILTGILTVADVFALLFAAIMHDLTVATGQVIYFHFGIGVSSLLGLGILFAWLWTMIAAWTGNYLRLPLIGSYAERYSAPPAQPIRHPLL
jgi:uncharacterized membrane protein